MTTFLRLLNDKDKHAALLSAVSNGGERVFDVDPASFYLIPGAPFAYWVSDAVRKTFQRLPPFEGSGRTVKQGLATADDFRFVRAWWEVTTNTDRWYGFAKGGGFSRFYTDISVVVNWFKNGLELKEFSGSVIRNPDYYFQPGISWPLRGITFSAQVVPQNCVFSVAGKMAFAPAQELESWLSIFNSRPFDYLVRLFAGKVGGVQYEVGLIGGIPVGEIKSDFERKLSNLARRGWSIKRELVSIEEKSHAFLLPSALRSRLSTYNQKTIESELSRIQTEIDTIAFDLYGFSESDRLAALDDGVVPEAEDTSDEEMDDEGVELVDVSDGLVSWTIGVAFGRFDWRLATGERKVPPEPNPFDPLPARSPGMLPNGDKPFHVHLGILVDEKGHPHDLAHLVEDVLGRVDVPIPDDIRNWLRRDFFSFHLKHYSKSKRKAPIYWPLSTVSGTYTLWIYYPTLGNQTLYSVINDFIEPKLMQVADVVKVFRDKGRARNQEDEKKFESQQALELELIDLRTKLLEIAPRYKPSNDDGVQITAAPLWPLFRHKPWQKVLKDTWEKLEKGDYDWAHLAMNYWPDRVREKCKTDKSIAIAHSLEELYVDPGTKPKKTKKTTVKK